MTIRSFASDDESDFLGLCKVFYESNATMRAYDEGITKMTFDRVMSKHENLWGLMVIDDTTTLPIGYALLTAYWCNEEGGNVIVIDELFVSAPYRHHGVGKYVMAWIEENYSDKAVAITLEVLTSNQTAQELYHKAGYEPDGFMTYTKRVTRKLQAL